MNRLFSQCLLLLGLLLSLVGTAQDSLSYSLTRFTQIRVGGTVLLTIQQGSPQSVTAKRLTLSNLVVKVVDQTLLIESDTTEHTLTNPTQLLITLPELTSLEIGGRSQADCVNALVSNHFDLLVKNNAQARINVVAASMTLKLTDASQVNLRASMGQLRGQMASTSRLDIQGTYGSVQLSKMP